MYTIQDAVHPATVCGLYRKNDVRLTPDELALSLQRDVRELVHMNIPIGPDGRIRRTEIDRRCPKHHRENAEVLANALSRP